MGVQQMKPRSVRKFPSPQGDATRYYMVWRCPRCGQPLEAYVERSHVMPRQQGAFRLRYARATMRKEMRDHVWAHDAVRKATA